MFIAKRNKMIENFSRVKKPDVYVKNYLDNFAALNKKPEYVNLVKEMREKPKAPYKIKHDPKDLLRFSKIKVEDLKLEKPYPFKYIEV